MKNRRLYSDLNTCVDLYKQSEGKEKDEVYKAIQEHLTHHINSICNILLDTNYYTVNKTVSKMMLAGFYASAKKGDLSHMKSIASKMTEGDLRQEIDIEIIRLMGSYVHKKNSFLEFVTFLLPRRISSILWKASKDMANQFDCDSIDGINDRNKMETSNVVPTEYLEDERWSQDDPEPEILSFLTPKEYQILVDYIAEGSTLEQVAKEHNMSPEVCERRIKELTHRVKTVLDNIKSNHKEGIDVGIQSIRDSQRKAEKQKRVLGSKSLQQNVYTDRSIGGNRRKSIWKMFKKICNRAFGDKNRSARQQGSMDVRIR